MAETIKRYTVSASVPICDCGALLQCRFRKRQDEDGFYVLYDDHAAALAAKDDEIERLRSAVVFAYHALDTIFIDTTDGDMETVAGEGLDMLRPIVEAMPHPVKPLRTEGG